MAYVYSFMNFHELNILVYSAPRSKRGHSQHPQSPLCRAQKQGSGLTLRGKVCEHIFSKAAHPSALGSSEPLHFFPSSFW